MEFRRRIPPRIFNPTGGDDSIADHGEIFLSPGEQVTFITQEGEKYDFIAKHWGYYATPSINRRLIDEGFRTALVRNQLGRHFVMVVRRQSMKEFNVYLRQECSEVIEWLDERGED